MDYDGVTMDKIDMKFYHVDKKTCTKITVYKPEQVYVNNKDNFTSFSKDAVLILSSNDGPLEFIQVESHIGITYFEECKLRKENRLVRELYEEYKVALILAHNGD